MGVINLSVLVDKIKRKLLNAGFITSSDKASKTKFGIVKIGNGLTVNSGVVSLESSGSSLELLKSGDFTDNVEVGSQYLRTVTGVDLSQYKLLFVTVSGSSTGSCSTAICDVSTTLGMMSFNLTQQGSLGMNQYNLAKSSGSEIYDSIYCSYSQSSANAKWGNIYGIK